MNARPDASLDRRSKLTAIEYAVLAMVGFSGQTAYELSLFASDGKWGLLGYSRSSLHEIPKRLERMGYLRSTVEEAQKGPSRTRYYLTDAGVAAARGWVTSPPSLPPVESELVARMLAYDSLGTEELFSTLLQLRTAVRLRDAELIADEITAQAPEAEVGRRLAIGLHRHLLKGYTDWLKDVERELKALQRRKSNAR